MRDTVANRLSETAIQCAVFQHIRQRGVPNTFAFHPRNESRDQRALAGINSGLGVISGTPHMVTTHIIGYQKYQTIYVSPNQLHSSPMQPETRGRTTGWSLSERRQRKEFNQLKKSIKEVGLQYPPLVLAEPNDKYQIVDGHRRVAAMKELEWKVIPVMLTRGNSGAIFAAVSKSVKL
jgi:hypothetical protein